MKVQVFPGELMKILQARVQTFVGERIIVVDHLWCGNGIPIRVWGDGYKFKMDEEPFELFWEKSE